MKKILFTATLRSHIGQFHQPFMKFFIDSGWSVHVASKDNTSQKRLALDHFNQYHEIAYERIPWKLGNLKAFFQMRRLLASEDFDIIHCHTPMAAFITRILAHKYRKNGLKVLYTAHGFHFFKGAPRRNWRYYYPIEKWLSRMTDCLITINSEDYQTAVSDRFSAGLIRKVSGVGVDLSTFTPQTSDRKKQLRERHGYSDQDFILLCAANLSYRKNQELIIRAAKEIQDQIPNLKIIFAGTGELKEQYRELIKSLHLEDSIEMIGYVRNIPEYLGLSDGLLTAARQEGLPVNVIEAMAVGLPVIATDCRGNRDLIIDQRNGRLIDLHDVHGFSQAILELYRTPSLGTAYGEESLRLVQAFGQDNVLSEMTDIYSSFMN